MRVAGLQLSLGDGMTRGPVVDLPSALRASQVKKWIDGVEGLEISLHIYHSTRHLRFAQLTEVSPSPSSSSSSIDIPYMRFYII
jgi:hydroxymethylglutaryl-CoA reductase